MKKTIKYKSDVFPLLLLFLATTNQGNNICGKPAIRNLIQDKFITFDMSLKIKSCVCAICQNVGCQCAYIGKGLSRGKARSETIN